MVTLNFTLLIELGLFLLFLWGTTAFIMRPALRSLDEREGVVNQARTEAEGHAAEAERLEATYEQKHARLREAAELVFREARRQALDAQLAQLDEERKRADAKILALREAAAKLNEEQRGQYAAIAPELVDAIARRFGIGAENP